MEYLQCKACGSFSMVPMEVELPEAEEEQDGQQEEEELDLDLTQDSEQESQFYTCQVCGDNWLSIKVEDKGGDTEITFIHQMGIQPVLKRVAHMTTHIVLNEDTVAHWVYYLGEEEVEENDWHEQLEERRQMLKSICCN
jgi:hypothetical protein